LPCCFFLAGNKTQGAAFSYQSVARDAPSPDFPPSRPRDLLMEVRSRPVAMPAPRFFKQPIWAVRVRRSSSPLSSGGLYKTPVRRRRLPAVDIKAPPIRAICRAAVGSNPPLNASQPQTRIAPTTTPNSQLHGSCSLGYRLKSPLLTRGHSPGFVLRFAFLSANSHCWRVYSLAESSAKTVSATLKPLCVAQ
jgi:hypothetical protein